MFLYSLLNLYFRLFTYLDFELLFPRVRKTGGFAILSVIGVLKIRQLSK